MRHYLREFPHFASENLPPALLDGAVFDDESYRHDACPLFIFRDGRADGQEIGVYVAEESADARELPDRPRFALVRFRHDPMESETLVESDEWADIEQAVGALKRTADTITTRS